MVTRYFIILILMSSIPGLNAQPVINSIISNNDTLYNYNKFELTVDFVASFDNPYDPEEVRLTGHFISPGGDTINSQGFYYQAFQEIIPDSLVANGSPVWKVRFTPVEAGLWEYFLEVKDSTGTVISNYYTFLCKNSGSAGFLQIDSGYYFFSNNNGDFMVIGENLCWGQSELRFSIFYDWIDKLAMNNANFIKIMMTPWAFEIEWQDTSIGDYSARQHVAWSLDKILDYAHERGIYTQLAFVIHGEFQNGSLWDQNPYNSGNGGPCTAPQHFFTDSAAQAYFDKKLQYIINRWAYHPGIAAWEIISEADIVEAYAQNKPEVRQWILEKSAFLKNNDPYNHPVTAGFAIAENDTIIWKSNLIDFVQTHIYDEVPDLEMRIYSNNLEYRERYKKPVINGEFGLYYNPDSAIANDPDGIAIHNVLWASSMSGSLGTGLSWWWDTYIHPQDLYYHFGGLSEFNPTSLTHNLNKFHPVRYNCVTEQSIDEIIEPGFGASLQKAPSSSFRLEQSGLLKPDRFKLGATLYGNGFLVSGFRNPPHFAVNYSDDGFFEVTTSGNVSNSILKISIDGQGVLNISPQPYSSYTVPVTAGKHDILIENSSGGNSLMGIESYRFINHSPIIKALVLAQKVDYIHSEPLSFGWIQHRNYNWYDVLNSGMPDTISNARLIIPDSLESFGVDVFLFNTITGQLIELIEYWPNGSGIIDLPPVSSDMAFAAWLPPQSINDNYRAGSFSIYVFPNPVADQTNITLNVKESAVISVRVYDIMGKLVTTLSKEEYHKGKYYINWNCNSAGPGIYLIVADDGKNKYTRKLIKY